MSAFGGASRNLQAVRPDRGNHYGWIGKIMRHPCEVPGSQFLTKFRQVEAKDSQRRFPDPWDALSRGHTGLFVNLGCGLPELCEKFVLPRPARTLRAPPGHARRGQRARCRNLSTTQYTASAATIAQAGMPIVLAAMSHNTDSAGAVRVATAIPPGSAVSQRQVMALPPPILTRLQVVA